MAGQSQYETQQWLDNNNRTNSVITGREQYDRLNND